MVDFRAPAQSLRETRRAEGHDHEFLHVGGLPACVCAAVQDVHHRHGQDVRVHAAEITIQRQSQRIGRGLRDRETDSQNGVRAQFGFVRRAVQRQQGKVNRALVGSVHAEQFARDRPVHVGDRLRHALAEVALLVAVAHFERFVLACRRARRDGGASPRTVHQRDFHFHGRVAA